MARKKSLKDLRAQALRLYDAADGDAARMERIRSTFRRYSANIHATKSQTNDRLERNELDRRMRERTTSRQQKREIDAAWSNSYKKSQLRQYSRSTYMGLANG